MSLFARNGCRARYSALLLGTAAGALCLPGAAYAQSQDDKTAAAEAQAAKSGQAPVQPVVQGAPQPESNEIVVSGLRASLEDALEFRRNADVILDGISSDDIGSTPDLNLGEALQRIPGVQINREAGRRDATISVRGLPGRFTKTTVMNQNIASPTRGENVGNPFGIFESGIFNGANVIKSFTADTPSGGLAAQVDLRITGALQRKSGVVLRAEMGYEETTEAYTPSFFASVAERLSDRLAVYGVASYSKQSFRRDSFRINTYGNYTAAQTAQFVAGTRASGTDDSNDVVSRIPNPSFDVPAVGENGLNNVFIFPREIRQFVQTNEGYRVSAAAGFGYEITGDLVFRVDGLFTRRDLTDSNQDIFLVNPNPAQSIVTPLGNPVPVGVVNFNNVGPEENVFLVPRVMVSDYLTAIGNREFPALDQTWALYPQFNFENDDWKFDLIGTYSKAKGLAELNQYDYRVNQRPGAPDVDGDGIDDTGNGSLAVFDIGTAGRLRDVSINTILPPNLLDLANAVGGTWTIRPDLIGANINIPNVAPNGTTQQVTISPLVAGFVDRVDRDLTSIDFDLVRKFTGTVLTEIAVGGFYSNENATRARTDNSALGLNFPALTNDIFVLNDGVAQGALFAGGRIPGAELDEFLSLDIPLVREQLGNPGRTLPAGVVFNPTAANLTNFFPELTQESATTITADEILQALPLNEETGYLRRIPTRNFIDRNFRSKRETVELYGMMKFDLQETSDIGLRGNIGVRYVKTDLSGRLTPVANELYNNLARIRAENGGPDLVFREGALLDPPRANNVFERILPSVNAIYEITPELVVRAAYYQTFEALDLAEFSPAPTLIREIEPGGDPDEATLPEVVGSDGNLIPSTIVDVSGLDIRPRRSEGFDLGLSWYNRPGSVVSIGVFRKSLIDDITRFSNFCPDSGTFTVGDQTFNEIRIADSGQFQGRCVFTNDLGDTQRIRINVSLNNPDTIDVTGFEAQIQQRLDFLPGFLKNTGFVANYTRVRSGGDNGAKLFNVAEDTYNLIGYYEDKLFEARLAYNNQSEIQLAGGGSFTGGATRVAPRDQLDFSGAIKPMEGLQLRFEVFNITQSSRREYLGTEALLRVFEYDGRTFAASATYRF
ncbi:TonB-dependent receptor [Erythrobacter sp.]|uniref:TonB-dependent receptor n=1 Tax=Erythrobacter sp. TaxID=1042 RepID=UPI0025CC7E44|nr:TonB-dependent receptor [Erythrobacter sp.]